MRRMKPRGTGHIVNVASSAGKTGFPHLATYCATKHGVVGLSEAVRAELRGTGVEISVVMPNIVKTELVDRPRRDPGVQELDASRTSPTRSSTRSSSRASTCSCRSRSGRRWAALQPRARAARASALGPRAQDRPRAAATPTASARAAYEARAAASAPAADASSPRPRPPSPRGRLAEPLEQRQQRLARRPTAVTWIAPGSRTQAITSSTWSRSSTNWNASAWRSERVDRARRRTPSRSCAASSCASPRGCGRTSRRW